MKSNSSALFFLAFLILLSATRALASDTTDYSASPSGAGINLYATSIHGTTKVTGSPFVPKPVPGGTLTPTPNPSFVTLDPEEEYVYALYEFGEFGPTDVVWSFKLISSGLKQLASASFPFGGGSPTHTDVGVLFFGATEHFVYVVNTPFGLNIPNLTLYKVEDGLFLESTTIQLTSTNEPSGFTQTPPTSVNLDDAHNLFYACYANGQDIINQGISPPSVGLYLIKDGVPIFEFLSTNAEYVGSKCP